MQNQVLVAHMAVERAMKQTISAQFTKAEKYDTLGLNSTSCFFNAVGLYISWTT
jgi:hypothetical protein